MYVHGAGTSTQPRSQVALPDEVVDVEASQSEHCAMFDVEENLPTPHSAHVRDPGDAAKVPGAQPVQKEAPLTSLAFPVGHAKQSELF